MGRRVLLFFLLSLCCAAGVQAQELMPASSAAWTGFSARPESAPALSASGADGAYALTIQGNNVPSVYGGWRTRISGLVGGQSYRFRTRAVTAEVERPREAITLLLRWRGSFGEQVAPDYVWQYRTQSDGSLLFVEPFRHPPAPRQSRSTSRCSGTPTGASPSTP